jgi:hypothetical protein
MFIPKYTKLYNVFYNGIFSDIGNNEEVALLFIGNSCVK